MNVGTWVRQVSQLFSSYQWLDGITDLMDVSLSELRELVDGQGGLACCNLWGRKELDTTERLI